VSIASSSGSAISPDQLADARKWIARQREKAWTLFESVAALPFPSSGGPWHTEMDTFDRNAAVDKIRPAFADVAAQGLVLFNPDEREGPQIPKFPLYEATFYNDAAYRHIRIEGLYQEGSAEKLVAMQRREISEFRKGSRVLKTFWRPVPERGAAEREAWIGVWKWRAKYEPDNASRIDESAWPNVSGRQPVCVVAEEPANGCLIADQHFVTGKPADIGHIQCVQGMKCRSTSRISHCQTGSGRRSGGRASSARLASNGHVTTHNAPRA
jgi:hypothetical protein